MARNESDLRDRWQSAYRNSGEYQAAQRRDAIAKVQRDRQGRAAMDAALAKGDTTRASAIQRSLQRQDVQPGESTAGLDAFQNQRVNDYITQAETRGQATAAAARSGPLSGVANGSGYYQSLENPDFSTHFPYGDIAPKVWIGMEGDAPPTSRRGPTAAGAKGAVAPSAPMNDEAVAMRENLAQSARSGYADALAKKRSEDHFTASLPNELRPAYTKLTSGMTPTEKTDFLSQPPELRYGRLRSALGANSPRSPNMGGTITTPNGIEHDFLGNGAPRVGSVGSSDFPSIMKPVTLTRPTAALAQPPAPKAPDYSVEAGALGF